MRVVALFLVLSLLVQPVYAGWMDDWLDQKVSTGASYFEGQKRGYYTAGSFSARVYTSRDYLLSITPPRFRAGCGGIDIFLGGFSYLKPDYLLEKLKRILGPGAAAAAFDIALSVLCEQCAKTIKSFEAIVDRLNQLNLDDCKASRALVAYLAKNVGAENEEINNAISDFLQSSGISDLWKEIKNVGKSNEGKVLSAEGKKIDDLFKGCPAEWRKYFAESGFLLDKVAEDKGYSSELAALIRGFVGDIYVNVDRDSIAFTYVPPCKQNTSFDVDSFITGNVYVRDSSGTCRRDSTAFNLLMRIQEKLNRIANKIRDGGMLNSDEVDFIQSTPVPVYKILKTAVATDTLGVVISNYSYPVAVAYAYGMAADLNKAALDLIDTLKEAGTAVRSGTSGDQHECQVKLASDALGKLERLEDRVLVALQTLRGSYFAKLGEIEQVIEMSRLVKEWEETIYKQLKDTFGDGVATRVVGSAS